MNAKLFQSLKFHLSIPDGLGIGHAGGEVRIVVSAALASPEFREELLNALGKCTPLARRFREHPIKEKDLIGAQLAELPLLEELEFVSDWEANGLPIAIGRARQNPMFRDHIHLFLNALVAFCSLHRLNTQGEIPARVVAHVRMLRYLLHATCTTSQILRN